MIQRPGKVVIWGEYAVLAGATAGVMAVDAHTTVNWHPLDGAVNITPLGLPSPGVHFPSLAFTGQPCADMLEHILRNFGYETYPEGISLSIDSSAFFQGQNKLGLGSSAAVYLSLLDLMQAWQGHEVTLAEAIELHHDWQGKIGSGIDVAASWHGGLIQFRDGHVTPTHWPADLHFRIIWSGAAANTPSYLNQFKHWRDSHDTSTLDALCSASEAVAQNISLQNLQAYIEALHAFDNAAKLGIYNETHLAIEQAAQHSRVTYKPCGAGGGDIGLALADDPERLSALDDLMPPGCGTLALQMCPPVG